MKITDLDFQIASWDVNKKKLVWSNIFDYYWIQWGVATWRTMSPKRKKEIKDPIFYIFGDTWSRCEWEMLVRGFPTNDEDEKVDVYSLFLKPNSKLLMEMINKVSANSCRVWLRENKR